MRRFGLIAGALLGAVALSAVVWIAADGDGSDRRVAALGAVQPLPEGVSGTLRWRGGFDCKATYEPLDVVVLEGSSYIAPKTIAECVTPPAEPWNLPAQAGGPGPSGAQGAAGQQGPPGSFNGTYQSPDGAFKLSVTNAGIALTGPSASVQVAPASVNVKGDAKVSVQSSATLEVRGGGPVTLIGGPLFLGGSTGCKPVARRDEPVVGFVAGPGPLAGVRVASGSANVSAC